MSDATIVIRMMPPAECSPNFHGSWRAKAKAVAEFRAQAGWATKAWVNSPNRPPLIGDWVCMDAEIAWTGRRKALDDDNAWASLKPARDGIADILFGGEDRFITQGRLTQTRGEGTVTVTLRALADAP